MGLKVTKRVVETIEAGDLVVRLHREDDGYPVSVDVVWTQPDGNKLVMALPGELLERAAKVVQTQTNRYPHEVCVVHGHFDRSVGPRYECPKCEAEEKATPLEEAPAF